MKTIPIIVCIFAAACMAGEGGEKENSIVELPRPNSGTYSFKQANERKNEIFSIATSEKDFKWENPYWGYGVHVNKKDEIEIYGGFLPKGVSQTVKLDELEEALIDLSSGNPMGVLITSELQPNKSNAFRDVLEKLFIPSIQIYYKRHNKAR